MRSEVHFLRNGKKVIRGSFDPSQTLLDYLRLEEKSCGTKEGCNEGDCGACTVAVGRLQPDGSLVYAPVNACIQLTGMLDGADIITVDDLAGKDGLHPVQKAMADMHGSQCGFCTPGFVMSLFCLYHSGETDTGRADISDWVAGNLCRCTGYRPIADAALKSCSDPSPDFLDARLEKTRGILSELSPQADLFVGTGKSFFAAPASAAGIADLYRRHPDAHILAGATDIGLWVTKQMRSLPKLISVSRARDLAEISWQDGALTIPAAVTYRQAEAAVSDIDPDLAELWRRIGSKQVRASGTVCGNIANGSPIGDTPPALIALGATLTLMSASGIREMPLEDYFLDYGEQDRKEGEFVHSVTIPKLKPGKAFRAFKLSKRFDQDISAVMLGVKVTLDGTRIRSARIAFGGMAATPKRAASAEKSLTGADIKDEAAIARSIEALSDDFSPITDMRASDDYRRKAARNLLLKALVEIGGTDTGMTRLIAHREVAEDA